MSLQAPWLEGPKLSDKIEASIANRAQSFEGRIKSDKIRIFLNKPIANRILVYIHDNNQTSSRQSNTYNSYMLS